MSVELKRKLPTVECDSDSDFKGEIKKVFKKNATKKIRALPASDSENESAVSDHSVENKKFGTNSDDDESICKIKKFLEDKENCKVNSSSNGSDDDEPLAIKSKKSRKLKIKKRIESSDEDECKNMMDKRSKLNENSKKMETLSENSDEDDNDKPLAVISKKSTEHMEMNKKIINKSSKENGDVASSEDDKPIIKIRKASEQNGQSIEVKISSEGSDDDDDDDKPMSKNSPEHLEVNKRIENESFKETESDSYSDHNKPLSKAILKEKQKSNKKQYSSSSCDDEPLADSKSMKKKSKNKSNSSDSSDEDKPLTNLPKATKQKNNTKKTKSSSNNKIDHMKKYIRLSGIHIQSYEKLFENCRSVKSKVEKLLAILHENGMKGRPTIEKCKKLKKKIETKKEIAELDTSNIIKSEGRPKRGLSERNIQKNKDITSSPAEKRFSSLKDIIDSEESD